MYFRGQEPAGNGGAQSLNQTWNVCGVGLRTERRIQQVTGIPKPRTAGIGKSQFKTNGHKVSVKQMKKFYRDLLTTSLL